MELLRARLRVTNLEESLDFFCAKIGLVEVGRDAAEQGRSTLVYLAAPEEVRRACENDAPLLELVCRPHAPVAGVPRAHVAYQIEDLYWLCHYLLHQGLTMHRPPRDGRMARVQSPDGHVVELWQQGNPREPAEPWIYMDDVDPDGAGLESTGREEVPDGHRRSGMPQ